MFGSFLHRCRGWLLAPLVAALQDSLKAAPRTVEQLALAALYRQQFQQGLAPYRFCESHREPQVGRSVGGRGRAQRGDRAGVLRVASQHKGLAAPLRERVVTRGNVNGLISGNGFVGDIDLLSIDVDGVDYWLWDAIDSISPRVVVTEINHLWGPERSVTVPYRDDFVGGFTEHGSDYAGASLAAFVKLGRRKGYRLVGTNSFATNAFFLRNDIGCAWLPEVEPRTCFDHPRARFGIEVRHAKIRDREWQDV